MRGPGAQATTHTRLLTAFRPGSEDGNVRHWAVVFLWKNIVCARRGFFVSFCRDSARARMRAGKKTARSGVFRTAPPWSRFAVLAKQKRNESGL